MGYQSILQKREITGAQMCVSILGWGKLVAHWRNFDRLLPSLAQHLMGLAAGPIL